MKGSEREYVSFFPWSVEGVDDEKSLFALSSSGTERQGDEEGKHGIMTGCPVAGWDGMEQ